MSRTNNYKIEEKIKGKKEEKEKIRRYNKMHVD